MTQHADADLDDLRSPSTDSGGVSGSPGKRNLTAGLAPSATSVAREVVRIMRKGERDDNGVAADAAVAVDRATSSSGAPLPDDVRGRFEGSLGTDLSAVRVHTGPESAAAASSVSARAYTVGQDIHFAAGQYRPADPFGVHLLAHEVAHTVQQSGGAPRIQHKLEVSAPGDAAEVEADRAADAMVAGQTAQITHAGMGALTLHRDFTISGGEDEDLNNTIYKEQRKSQTLITDNWTFGQGQIYDEKNKPNTKNEVVKNAMMPGWNGPAPFEKLARLTEEYDVLKPLMIAWVDASTGVNTVASSQGLNPFTPEAYKDDLLAVHDAMTKDTPGNDAASNTSRDLRRIWSEAQTAKNVQGATKRLTSLTTKLQIAKNNLSMLQNQLEIAKKQDEIKDNKAKLAEIEARIQAISNIITGIAKVIAAVASMAATAGATAPAAGPAIADALSLNMEETFTLVALQNAHEQSEAAQAGDRKVRGAMGGVGKAADWVGGKGDLLEKGLRATVFKEEITTLTSKINDLQGQIDGLGLKNSGISAANIGLAMQAAQQEYDAVSKEVDNSKEKFTASMQEFGRRFDRKDIRTGSDAEDIDRALTSTKGPIAGNGRGVSMEAVFMLYAQLQKRGAARGAFRDMLQNSPNVRNAKQIEADSLEASQRYIVMSEERAWGATTPSIPIDQDPMNLGGSMRTQQMRDDALKLRTTVALCTGAVAALDTGDADQTSVEARWETLVTQSMKGIK